MTIFRRLEKFWKNYKREDLPAHTDPSKQIVSPSSKVISDICEKEKFCKSQGPITFGQLRKIIESLIINKEIYYLPTSIFIKNYKLDIKYNS